MKECGHFYEKNRLAETVSEKTGSDPEDVIYTGSLKKQFSVKLDIQITMTVQKEVSTIRKKYSLHYSWKDEPFEWYEDDYTISTSRYMGEWVE